MKPRLLQLLERAGQLFPPVLREESGQDLVEYSLLVLLIGTATVAAVDRFGDYLYYAFYRITYWFVHAGHHYRFH
jgi:Flp pilus assembly pilin Flp